MRFGLFTFNPSSGELWKSGTLIHLAPQPAKVLTELLVRSGEVVTREELQSRLWGASTTVEFDAGLNRCIRQLKAALSDTAVAPRYIETLSRKGYRFIAPVERSTATNAPRVANPHPAMEQAAIPVEQESSIPLAEREFLKPVAHSAATADMRLVWVVASAAIAVGLFTAWWFWRTRARELPSDKAARFDVIPFTTYLGQQYSPGFSPDGQVVAFVWNGERQDNYDIYVKDLRTQKLRRMTTAAEVDYSPAFSPDGRWIAFCRGNDAAGGALMLVPTLGGAERTVTQLQTIALPASHVLSWSPDSQWLLVSTSVKSDEERGIALVSTETGRAIELTKPEPGLTDTYPALSPNGRVAAFVRDLGRGVSILHVMPFERAMMDRSRLRALHFNGFERVYVGAPSWTPDGKQIIFESNRGGSYRLWSTPIDQSTPPRVLEGLSDRAHTPAVSANGDLIYVRDMTMINLWRVTLSKKRNGTRAVGLIERIVGSTREATSPSISDDGKKLVFSSNQSGYSEIWTSNADGTNQVQLTSFNNPLTGSPAWSPDGRQIVFDSRAEGEPMIYVMSGEGGSPVKVTSGHSRNVLPTWSPDGKWIYFSSDRSGQMEIWKTSAQGESPQQVTRHGGFSSHFSPDGRYLFYTRDNQLRSALWRLELASRTETLVAASILNREFAPSADGVYFFSSSTPKTSTLQFSNCSSIVQSLQTFERPLRFGVALSPNGQHLYYGQFDEDNANLMLVRKMWH